MGRKYEFQFEFEPDEQRIAESFHTTIDRISHIFDRFQQYDPDSNMGGSDYFMSLVEDGTVKSGDVMALAVMYLMDALRRIVEKEKLLQTMTEVKDTLVDLLDCDGNCDGCDRCSEDSQSVPDGISKCFCKHCIIENCEECNLKETT